MNILNRMFFCCALMLATGSILTTSILAVESNEDCSRELLIAYFPENFVLETLKKHGVPEENWQPIVQELNNKEGEIVQIVEEKAEKMPNNPLKDPKQRQEAVMIFRETLLEVFGKTLNKYGVTDTQQIQTMLDDVQQQKAKRFTQCMEKHRSEMQSTPENSPANGNSRSGSLLSESSGHQQKKPSLNDLKSDDEVEQNEKINSDRQNVFDRDEDNFFSDSDEESWSIDDFNN